MPSGNTAPTTARYQYPSADAQFTLYNFHSQQQVNTLTDILVTKTTQTPRVIQLFGDIGTGRHYLLRSAAHLALQQGVRVAVYDLNLEGYEPDAPLKEFLKFLANRASGGAGDKLTELSKRTKVELKATPATLLFVSLGIKADFTVEELLTFFNATSQTPAGEISDPELLRRFIARLTSNQRLALHITNAHTTGGALILRLIDETERNPEFFLSLGLPFGVPSAPKLRRDHFSLHIPSWTREEMKISFNERFKPHALPEEFFDFAWSSGSAAHSRQSFATTLLRVITKGALTTDPKGTWRIDKHWNKNQSLIEEFERDLTQPVLTLRSQLRDSVRLFDFLDLASICDPTIPVTLLVTFLGMPAEETDDFISQIDDAFNTDQPEGIFQDLGFNHPGFPNSLLLYRFCNPLLPEALLSHHPNQRQLAIRLLSAFEDQLRPDTRAVADLYWRLTDRAGKLGDSERYANLLSYWCSLSESEELGKALDQEMIHGNISPTQLWSVIRAVEESWPPLRLLALIDAYGRQKGGVAASNWPTYLYTRAKALHRAAYFSETLAVTREVLASELPETQWYMQFGLHHLAGISELNLAHLPEAEQWLQSALKLGYANLPYDSPSLAPTLSALGEVYKNLDRPTEAESLFQSALAIDEESFGPEHAKTAASLHNLAQLYKSQNKLAEAEPLFQRALAIEENTLGPEHQNLAITLTNLGGLYEAQGRLIEARTLVQRALAIQEKTLGPDHPDTAVTLNNLAVLCLTESNPAEAAPLLELALAIQEKALGPNHPIIATTLKNLAALSEGQGHLAEAQSFTERADAIRQLSNEPHGPKPPS